MNTFLVTWNPRKFAWNDLDKQYERVRRKGFLNELWTCRTTRVEKGDRIFLLRQGVDPRGIMGAGYALSEAKTGTHYAGTGAAMRYIDVRWDNLLHPMREPILQRRELDGAAFTDMHWDTQSSGTVIPAKVAAALEKRWTTFLSAHGYSPVTTPDEIVSPERYLEGAVKKVTVNAYERSPCARAECIKRYGFACSVCTMDFENTYGEMGREFIHVHHTRPLASIGGDMRLIQ